MIADSKDSPAGQEVQTDICIIGGGAAGITLARELDGGPLAVSLLESGGTEFDAFAHELCQGDNIGLPYFPLDGCRLRGLGGTTGHWNGACWPFDPGDFEERPGVAHSGWPFGLAELEPFYRRAHVVCQLGPYDYDVAHFEDPRTRPRLAFEPPLRTKIIQSSPPTRFGLAYGEQLARSANVTTHLHTTALELLTDSSEGRVRELVAAARPGHELRFRARLFVLAAGGLENPRLLLLSRGARPEGIGNRHDLVGRFFTDHPHMRLATLAVDDPARTLALYQRTALGGDVTCRGVVAATGSWLRDERLLGFGASIWRLQRGWFSDDDELHYPGIGALSRIGRSLEQGEMPSHLGAEIASVLGDIDVIGSRIWDRLRTGRWPGHDLAAMDVVIEAEPNPESRVRLGDTRDAFGLERLELDWRLTPLAKRSIRRAIELIASETGRLGLGRLRIYLDGPDDEWARWDGSSPWRGPNGSYHHMGTTRMHVDPRQGVVDPQGRVHGLDNLYVAGSSVFPTGSHVNPTLTLVALALRLADHLKAVA